MIGPESEEEEFIFYMKFAKQLVLNVADTNERIKAAAWIRKLRQEDTEVSLRLQYLKLLLFTLQKRKLVGPFANVPEEDKPLERFPYESNLQDVAKYFTEVDQKVLRETLEKGGYGEWPPFTVACSSDLREYAASQEIPGFGTHIYFAISNDPVLKWNNFHCAVPPAGEKFDTKQLEWKTGQDISPDISCFQSPEPESFETRKPAADKDEDKETKKDVGQGGTYDLEPRVPPTWGSNLISVEDSAEYEELRRLEREVLGSSTDRSRQYSPTESKLSKRADELHAQLYTPPSKKMGDLFPGITDVEKEDLYVVEQPHELSEAPSMDEPPMTQEEFAQMAFLNAESTPPSFILEGVHRIMPKKSDANQMLFREEMQSLASYIQDEVAMISANVPFTTPHRSPSPKRPNLFDESIEFPSSIESEPRSRSEPEIEQLFVKETEQEMRDRIQKRYQKRPPVILDEPVPSGLPQSLVPPAGFTWRTPPHLKVPPSKKPLLKDTSGRDFVPKSAKIPETVTLAYEETPPDMYSPTMIVEPLIDAMPPSPPPSPQTRIFSDRYTGYGIQEEGEPEYYQSPESTPEYKRKIKQQKIALGLRQKSPETQQEFEAAELAELEAELFKDTTPKKKLKERIKESPPTPEYMRKAWKQEVKLRDSCVCTPRPKRAAPILTSITEKPAEEFVSVFDRGTPPQRIIPKTTQVPVFTTKKLMPPVYPNLPPSPPSEYISHGLLSPIRHEVAHIPRIHLLPKQPYYSPESTGYIPGMKITKTQRKLDFSSSPPELPEAIINEQVKRDQELRDKIRKRFVRPQLPIIDQPVPSGLPQPLIPPAEFTWRTPPHLKVGPSKRPLLKDTSGRDFVPKSTKLPETVTLAYEETPPDMYSPTMIVEPLIDAMPPSPPISPTAEFLAERYTGYGLEEEEAPAYYQSPESTPEYKRKIKQQEIALGLRQKSPETREEFEAAELAELEAELFKDTTPKKKVKEPIRESPPTPEYMRKAWKQEVKLRDPCVCTPRPRRAAPILTSITEKPAEEFVSVFDRGTPPPKIIPKQLQVPVIPTKKLMSPVYPTSPPSPHGEYIDHGLPSPIRHEYKFPAKIQTQPGEYYFSPEQAHYVPGTKVLKTRTKLDFSTTPPTIQEASAIEVEDATVTKQFVYQPSPEHKETLKFRPDFLELSSKFDKTVEMESPPPEFDSPVETFAVQLPDVSETSFLDEQTLEYMETSEKEDEMNFAQLFSDTYVDEYLDETEEPEYYVSPHSTPETMEQLYAEISEIESEVFKERLTRQRTKPPVIESPPTPEGLRKAWKQELQLYASRKYKELPKSAKKPGLSSVRETVAEEVETRLQQQVQPPENWVYVTPPKLKTESKKKKKSPEMLKPLPYSHFGHGTPCMQVEIETSGKPLQGTLSVEFDFPAAENVVPIEEELYPEPLFEDSEGEISPIEAADFEAENYDYFMPSAYDRSQYISEEALPEYYESPQSTPEYMRKVKQQEIELELRKPSPRTEQELLQAEIEELERDVIYRKKTPPAQPPQYEESPETPEAFMRAWKQQVKISEPMKTGHRFRKCIKIPLLSPPQEDPIPVDLGWITPPEYKPEHQTTFYSYAVAPPDLEEEDPPEGMYSPTNIVTMKSALPATVPNISEEQMPAFESPPGGIFQDDECVCSTPHPIMHKVLPYAPKPRREIRMEHDLPPLPQIQKESRVGEWLDQFQQETQIRKQRNIARAQEIREDLRRQFGISPIPEAPVEVQETSPPRNVQPWVWKTPPEQQTPRPERTMLKSPRDVVTPPYEKRVFFPRNLEECCEDPVCQRTPTSRSSPAKTPCRSATKSPRRSPTK